MNIHTVLPQNRNSDLQTSGDCKHSENSLLLKMTIRCKPHRYLTVSQGPAIFLLDDRKGTPEFTWLIFHLWLFMMECMSEKR